MKINTGYKVMILLAIGLLVLMSCSQPDSGSDTLGRVWKRVLDNSADDKGTTTQFPKRSIFGAVVFNGKMWVIGGKLSNDNILNDVWSSEDGITWKNEKQANPTPGSDLFPPRSLYGLVATDDKIYVIGGAAKGSDNLNDVWSSEDGITWKNIKPNKLNPEDDQFTQRYGHGVTFFKNKLWVIGGVNDSNLNGLNDVWSSEDGITWKREKENKETPDTGQFPQVSLFGLTEFQNKLWIVGGQQGADKVNEIWSSDNGINWTKEVPHSDIAQADNNTSPHFAERSGLQLLVSGNKLYLVSGGNYNDVWSTSDGKKWSIILNRTQVGLDDTGQFIRRDGLKALEFNNKFWLFGGQSIEGDFLNDVWVSE